MKLKYRMAVAVISYLTLPVAAAPNSPPLTPPPGDRVDSTRVNYNDLVEASKILGMNVTDPQEHKLGTAKDMAINLSGGQIEEIVVGTGGFAGVDEKMIAVPPQALSFGNAGKELRVADPQAFRTAPYFKMSRWAEATSSENVADAYNRFHVAGPSARGSSLERASKVIGATARNQQREDLGKVEDMVIDLSGPKILEVILSSGGFLGMNGELTAIAPQSFQYLPGQDALTLDTTREAIKGAPHFKASDWRNSVNNAASLNLSYAGFRATQDLTPAPSETTEVNTPPKESPPPEASSVRQSDSAVTSRIEQLISNAGGLSLDARKTQVTTASGQVTLRGVAENYREKMQLGDLASTVVPADHVDNEITIRNVAGASAANNQ